MKNIIIIILIIIIIGLYFYTSPTKEMLKTTGKAVFNQVKETFSSTQKELEKNNLPTDEESENT